MPNVTSVERLAKDEGCEEGRKEGRAQGSNSLLIRILARRFGQSFTEMGGWIESLPSAQFEALGDSLWDFQSLDAVKEWFVRIECQAAESDSSVPSRF
jgi:hypothetical protein